MSRPLLAGDTVARLHAATAAFARALRGRHDEDCAVPHTHEVTCQTAQHTYLAIDEPGVFTHGDHTGQFFAADVIGANSRRLLLRDDPDGVYVGGCLIADVHDLDDLLSALTEFRNRRGAPDLKAFEAAALRNVSHNPRPLCRDFLAQAPPAEFWCATCRWNRPMHDDEGCRDAIAAELHRIEPRGVDTDAVLDHLPRYCPRCGEPNPGLVNDEMFCKRCDWTEVRNHGKA